VKPPNGRATPPLSWGANASVLGSGEFVWEIPDQRWEDTLNINVTGVWNTVRACAPHMIEAGRGGAIVITSSTAGLSATARTGHRVGAAFHPGQHHSSDYGCHQNDPQPVPVPALPARPGNPALEDVAQPLTPLNLLPVPWLQPEDISNALLWLVSDEAQYVTGVALPVDAGAAIK